MWNSDPTGLTDKILKAVYAIDAGRKGLATDGKEHEGRLSYEKGIAAASAAFAEAVSTSDPQTIILVEEAFLEQELFFCDEQDIITRSSLTQALQSFDDALRCLEAVEDPGYKIAEKTYPTMVKYRIQDFPKDAFHLACIAHRTRLQNSLRTPGINMLEKAVLQQRAANMTSAQADYIEKQKKVLAKDA